MIKVLKYLLKILTFLVSTIFSNLLKFNLNFTKISLFCAPNFCGNRCAPILNLVHKFENLCTKLCTNLRCYERHMCHGDHRHSILAEIILDTLSFSFYSTIQTILLSQNLSLKNFALYNNNWYIQELSDSFIQLGLARPMCEQNIILY